MPSSSNDSLRRNEECICWFLLRFIDHYKVRCLIIFGPSFYIISYFKHLTDLLQFTVVLFDTLFFTSFFSDFIFDIFSLDCPLSPSFDTYEKEVKKNIIAELLSLVMKFWLQMNGISS